jgi:hypothetical protein
MNIIQKLTIQKLALDRFNLHITTKGLTKTQHVIVKIDRRYFFTKRVSEFIYLVELTFLPQKDIDHHIKVLVYDSSIDQIIDAKQEFINLVEIQSIKFFGDEELMRMSNLSETGWVGLLEVNTISGPFQFDKRVQKIDFNQPVSFHAFVNHPDAHKVQLVSMKWLIQLPTGKIVDVRDLKGFSIDPKQGYVVVSFYLSEPTSFQLIVSFSQFRKTNFEYKHFIPSQNPKIKVHFTIGMFFDGTGNNRFNSESVYYDKLNEKNLVYTKVPKEKKLPNGVVIDSGSSYWNPYSNVVLLHDLYETINEDGSVVGENKSVVKIKEYIQGIGTLRDSEDDFWGSALGEMERGIVGKVAEGCNQLAKSIKGTLGDDKEIGSLTFDVFGFSRGAASARHFCNEILGKQSIEDITESIFPGNPSDRSTKNDNIQPPKTSKIMKPIGRKYKLGLLGRALQLQKTQHELMYYDKPMNSQAKNNADLLKDIEKHRIAYENNAPVKIRFVGLFDTVVAQMIIKNHFGKKFDIANLILPSPLKLPFGIGTLAELLFDKVKQKIDHLPIQQVVHLIAQDEWRANFASTKAGVGHNIFEIALRGAHSDIGGSYMAKKEDSDIVDFEYVATFDKNNIPKSDRLDKLKNFYKLNGYAKEENIKIVNKLIFEDYSTESGYTKYHYLKQLVITRQITPRFSIVNMKVMQALAVESGLNFEGNTKNTNYPFEYDTPKELEKYQKELIEYVLQKFKGKLPKPIKNPVQKQKFLHLSANYNSAALFDNAGENITGIKLLDNIFYYNAPRYENNNRNSYKREDYTHNK